MLTASGLTKDLTGHGGFELVKGVPVFKYDHEMLKKSSMKHPNNILNLKKDIVMSFSSSYY